MSFWISGFIEQVTSIDYDNFNFEDKAELKKLIVFLSKWVLQHIRNEDFKYSSYVSDVKDRMSKS